MHETRTLLLAALLLVAGCATYEPKPLRLGGHDRAWLARPLDGEPVRWYAQRLAAGEDDAMKDDAAGETLALDATDGLSLHEAEAVALYYNADLRVARAKAKVTRAGADHAGLWDDPKLDFELLRIAESVPDPWVAGVGVGFTIPLSGRLEVEKDKAWAEHAAAWRQVIADEQETLAELRRQWLTWSATQQRIALIEAHIERVRPIAQTARQLLEQGEIDPTDAFVFDVELAQREAEIARLRATLVAQRRALLRTLGLSPDAPVEFVASFDAPSANDVDHAALLDHPRLAQARAAYEVAEQKLRLEIRRQYPDLHIGPAYESEEGQSKIGFSAGIPVPLFNRNQRGIAEAAVARDAARIEAEHVYETLAHELAEARGRLAAAQQHRQALAETIAPLIDKQIEAMRKLIDRGELNVLLIREVLARSLETKQDLLDTTLAELTARRDVEALLRPRWRGGAMKDRRSNETYQEETNRPAQGATR